VSVRPDLVTQGSPAMASGMENSSEVCRGRGDEKYRAHREQSVQKPESYALR